MGILKGRLRILGEDRYKLPNWIWDTVKKGDILDALIKNKIFLIYKNIQSEAVAKSYMRKGFLIYEEMLKYFPIYEEAVSHT